MLKLYILRHGKAVKPENAVNDEQRKLNKKGTAQVNQIGYILKESNCNIEEIIASAAVRTTETAEIVNSYLTKTITFDPNLYLASRETIQSIFLNKVTQKTVLLVGHNFGLSDFVNYLTDDNLTLSTSMLVEINFNFEDWNMIGFGTGTIEQIIEPKVHSF